MRPTRFCVGSGLALAADVGGDPTAPCVILLHGGGQTRFSWLLAGKALVGAGYHVINFDARGHGESDWAGPGGYSLAQHSADLRAIVAKLTGPVALVGASLGGATALRAMADGLRPGAVVLVDIVPNPDPSEVRRIRAFMQAHPDGFSSPDEAAAAIASYNPHRPRPADPTGLARNLRRQPNGRFKWHWDPEFLGREIETELAELAETIEGVRAARDVPVLLIRGSKSEIVSDEGTAALRDALPQLEVFSVAGAGHMVVGDRNDAFNLATLQFLNRHFPAAEGIDQ